MTPERQAQLREWAEIHATQTSLPLRHEVRAKLFECLDALRDAATEIAKRDDALQALNGQLDGTEGELRDAEQERDKLLDCDPLVTCCSNCDRSHHRVCPKIAEAERDEARRQLAEYRDTLEATARNAIAAEDRLRAVEGVLATLTAALERMIHTIDAEALHWPVKVHIKKCIGEAQNALVAAEALHAR